MNKFWIQKLRELKSRMRNHLAEKARFEAKPERTSIADLREGQRLKRAEDEICSHFAQLAEFATGIPADNYDFRLNLKDPYVISEEGDLSFGPSALSENHPYLNFDPGILYGPAKDLKEKELEEPVEEPAPAGDKNLDFSQKISSKYEDSVFKIAAARKVTGLKPIKSESRIDRFIDKISKAENYVTAIVAKYAAEPSEAPPESGFFMYQGEFVFLSRKGKWSSVRTTTLTQKDYFARTAFAIPADKRRLPVIEPGKELAIEDAAELITDEFAEPVGSPSTDLGLGYFIPTRRMGKTQEPEAAMPLLGSPEFAADVAKKAESSGKPIEEISPAYVTMAGRKIDRARSFADMIKRRLQLPRSEPVRQAVVALLPRIKEIISRSEKEEGLEESILAFERDFDRLVEARIRMFKIAARSTTSARFSPVLEQGKIERIFESPTTDILGVIRRYAPEEGRPVAPAASLLRFFRTMRPGWEPRAEEVIAMSDISGPTLPGEKAPTEGMEWTTSVSPDRAPSKPGLAKSPAFGQELVGKIGEKVGALLQPGKPDARGPLSGAMGLLGTVLKSEKAQGFASSIIKKLPLSGIEKMLPKGISRLLPGAPGKTGSLLSGIAPQAMNVAGEGASELAQMIDGGKSKRKGIAGGMFGRLLGGGSPLSKFVSKALPLAGGLIGKAKDMLPGIARKADGLTGVLSGLTGETSEEPGGPISGLLLKPGTAGTAQQPLPPQSPSKPRGWDRPPFEVGDAIQRHISDEIPEKVGELTRRVPSSLRDYGLSVIDLEDRSVEDVRSPLQRTQDESGVEIDDETIDSIYFRLRRILETESERMGGEA